MMHRHGSLSTHKCLVDMVKKSEILKRNHLKFFAFTELNLISEINQVVFVAMLTSSEISASYLHNISINNIVQNSRSSKFEL